ncbi:MAG: c-type cytochrome, partial [Hyphomicrobiales bacterium]
MPAELTPHRRWLKAVLAVAFVSLISSGSPGRADDIEQGRKLAQQHCTRCHIVADMNTVSIGSTPSFRTMVNST